MVRNIDLTNRAEVNERLLASGPPVPNCYEAGPIVNMLPRQTIMEEISAPGVASHLRSDRPKTRMMDRNRRW